MAEGAAVCVLRAGLVLGEDCLAAILVRLGVEAQTKKKTTPPGKPSDFWYSCHSLLRLIVSPLTLLTIVVPNVVLVLFCELVVRHA